MPFGEKLRYVLQLKGGLGNQLFQYSMLRAQNLATGYPYILDRHSGFFRDKVYRRQFELYRLPINQGNLSKRAQILAFLIVSTQRLKSPIKDFLNHLLRAKIVDDSSHELIELPFDPPAKNLTLLTGYWQSYKYFDAYKEVISKEVVLENFLNTNFVELARTIQSSPSVAVGLRFYEESPNPRDQAKDGRTKNLEQISDVLRRTLRDHPHCKIYVFSAVETDDILNFSRAFNGTLVKPSQGFSDPLQTMKLQSLCDHHIIMNSSFFWWGAYLSYQGSELPSDKEIYAADNFLNPNTIPTDWKLY